MEFPIISVANIHSDFDTVSKQLFDAACKWGFFIITDHGITKADEVSELSRAFFDLPMDVKTEKMVDNSAIGYDGGKKLTSFAASEAILFGTPAGGVLGSNNLGAWWDESKRQTVEAFKAECYDLTITMMSGFAVCMGLDRDYFTRIHGHQAPGHTLRSIKYPKFDSRPQEGQLPRLSSHTDWGSLTFVFTKQAGLEIQDPQDRWFHVPVVPEGIVVNIGDALSLWTGRTLKSTLHRITWENLPPDQDRYSMAYFSQPNNSAQLNSLSKSGEIVPIPLTYGDYYKVRYHLTYGAHTDSKTGEKILEDIDPAMAQAVHDLGVADAGSLRSNTLVAV
ncbi:uncharacterized protein PV07_03978 [Cladophialophora immunda]|uniref:Fe2OG dioxygenase domain-containing protein n=1 Tax=Cladophialophora immunda TaxID=569365 RepID=A0A0D2D9P7_9EURO|nr:uncharacterized protein PV07_03978 [Cladophialophora immunda]KIW32429.1 hypothetical protein PV07_03978 [Cladophialophora immunda]